MIEFEINGKKCKAPEGTTIIEAADQAGEYIPRFCYHNKLSVSANCRMCLVEVEKARKPMPACATPLMQDMKISTKSEMALKAQRDVMQFLLINHPLDCPICDQGGECELQDLSMGYGQDKSEYDFPKRAVASPDIGPLIETEMTRCIQCTRCVRFGEEIAGVRELGVLNRGEKEAIGTYVARVVKSELSGNVIDLCPVGALTNKPARYRMRAWEATEHPNISPHDCLGTNMFVHSRGRENSKVREIFRAVPRENEAINETWMSDRDRFAVSGLYHNERITQPLMKKKGVWTQVSWQYALDALVHLTKHIQKESGQEQLAAIAGYQSTVEEYYLLQKLIRGLGSSHVDHRIRELDFRDQAHRDLFPELHQSIASIEESDALLLVGSNVRFEQPILGARIFKAVQDGLSVMAVNPVDYPFVFELSEKIITDNIIASLAEIAKALADNKGETPAELSSVQPSEKAHALAAHLLKAQKPVIYMGAFAQHHPRAADIRALVNMIAQYTGAVAGELTDGPNTAGAWLTGCVPHRGPAGALATQTGKDAKALLTTDPVDAYFLYQVEPELDSVYPAQALKTLKEAKLVACFSPFATEQMREYADFILPIAPFTETDGTYVNVTGDWQSFDAVSAPHADSKPGWKVLRVLGNLFGLSGFSYQSANAIRDALRSQANHVDSKVASTASFSVDLSRDAISKPTWVFDWSMYRDNPLVRRAEPLQMMIDKNEKAIRLNAKTASALGWSANDEIKGLAVCIDESIARNLVIVPAGYAASIDVGAHFGGVS